MFSEEHKQKLRLARAERKLRLGFLNSPETRKKMSDAKIGRVMSEETKKKISLSHKGKKAYQWRGGKPFCECGKRLATRVSKRCVECFRKSIKGEKHWQWKDDRSGIVYIGDRRSVCYKHWRRKVQERDKFKCKMLNTDCSGRIEVHHILGFTQYPELRYEVNNGITLCHFHHPRKRNDEIKLSPYFKELIKAK